MDLPAVANKEKVKNLMDLLEARKGSFQDLLPKYLTPERLFRVAQLAISKNPLLLQCTPASFVVAMMDTARAGLEPNGKDAALIPYGKECQFQPMYQGLIKQAVNGGAAKKIGARIVHANDRFKLWYDPEPHLEHEPALENEGDVIAAYAYAILPDGSTHIEYMNKRQLDHIKGKSKARTGPWQTDEEEMYRKTPVKRLFKYLPVPEEVEYAVAIDNQIESGKRREEIPLLEPAPPDLQQIPQTQTEKIREKLKPGPKPKAPPAPQESGDWGKPPLTTTPGTDVPQAETAGLSHEESPPPIAITSEQVELIKDGLKEKALPVAMVLKDWEVSKLEELTVQGFQEVMAWIEKI